MKATLSATPVFHIAIVNEELEVLKWLAEHHYDYVCRSTLDKAGPGGRTNGILTMWQNGMEFHAAEKEVGQYHQSLSFREVDILCKILEDKTGLNARSMSLAAGLRFEFRYCLMEAGRLVRPLSWELYK